MKIEDLPRPRNYKPGTGNNRYARFIGDWLGLERTEVLDDIAESLDEHGQTLVVGGNGLGKSYDASALGIAALYCNPNTVVPITAGNGDTLKNSIWKPIKSLWRNSELPGDYKDNDRSLHTGFDDEWFLECHSPKYPDDLEGDHNANVIYIIEEADKPGLTAEHIDSARSTLAEGDHILVLCNPPTDETNIVYELEQRDSWNVLRYPTWESRNARADRGLTDRPKIGGLSGVGKMKDDWAEYHDEEWPGIDQVIEWSSPYLTEDGEPTVRETVAEEDNPDFRTDLHEKWYKRRAGVMPPQGASKWRPFSISDVRAAYKRTEFRDGACNTAGLDVARSNDETVLSGKHGQHIRVHYNEKGTNHVKQKEAIRAELLDLNGPEIAVDAVGEGSGLADELDMHFSSVHRFSNGATARDDEEYRDCWAEALALFGEFLDNGGVIHNDRLREELMAAARVVEFDDKTLRSRGGDVIEATPKEEIKEQLGHSPDYLDSALMANWVDLAKETHRVVKPSVTEPII
ncbi:hypothetical protein [Natrialba taiwanensis]|uniref:Uncharacterized protein n=1 Tax=Natrialba taiwanensis DSM 12281 TaxID=1230458 RepID=L9ZYS2_9EURY|nr:hypothetical protein [Natrialba taiwanensis]ELY91464.1 hypothetical protein C484_10566 [Natrialba taiwanensis DSM 12281]